MTQSKRVLRVLEPGPSLKYAALYVAEELGYFDQAGVSVDISRNAGPGGTWLVDALLEDRADLAIGGLWMPLLYQQNGLGRFVALAGLCHAHPAVVLGRRTMPRPFVWQDLVAMRTLLPQGSTAQWMYIEGLLREQSIDPSSAHIIRDLHVRTCTSLWRAGYCDYYIIDPQEAEPLIDEGAIIVAELATLAGPVPWSIVYAVASAAAGKQEPIAEFVKAVERGQSWINSTPLEEVSSMLARYLPDASQSHIARVVERQIRSGVWRSNLRLVASEAARFQQFMVGYGLYDAIADLGQLGVHTASQR